MGLPDSFSLPSGRARTRLAPGERREQLLEVGRVLLERDGYDLVTFEGLAREAGVSAALVHHYFRSKRDLFLGVVSEAIRGFQEAVAPPGVVAPLDAERPPRERLRAAVERYLDFVLDRPNGYAFVIGEHGVPDGEVRAAIDVARRAVHRAVLALIGIGEPTATEDLLMWGWLGFVERVTTRWMDEGGVDRSALMELLLDAAAPLFERFEGG